MTHAPILLRLPPKPDEPKFPSETNAWLRRAQQARRIATMLTGNDAYLCEQFAMECEAKASQRPRNAQIAA